MTSTAEPVMATVGTVPGWRPVGDEVPAGLSSGCTTWIGKPSRHATTPEGAALLATLNGPVQDPGDDDEPWVCGFCGRGQCARCSDDDCACCAGNPEGSA